MANEMRRDLIDRNELLPNGVFYVSSENPMASLDELLNRIANATTVDAVEVVHGRWHEDEGLTSCSHCGALFDTNLRMLQVPSTWEMPNYCPNCGAKMDGDMNE